MFVHVLISMRPRIRYGAVLLVLLGVTGCATVRRQLPEEPRILSVSHGEQPIKGGTRWRAQAFRQGDKPHRIVLQLEPGECVKVTHKSTRLVLRSEAFPDREQARWTAIVGGGVIGLGGLLLATAHTQPDDCEGKPKCYTTGQVLATGTMAVLGGAIAVGIGLYRLLVSPVIEERPPLDRVATVVHEGTEHTCDNGSPAGVRLNVALANIKPSLTMSSDVRGEAFVDLDPRQYRQLPPVARATISTESEVLGDIDLDHWLLPAWSQAPEYRPKWLRDPLLPFVQGGSLSDAGRGLWASALCFPLRGNCSTIPTILSEEGKASPVWHQHAVPFCELVRVAGPTKQRESPSEFAWEYGLGLTREKNIVLGMAFRDCTLDNARQGTISVQVQP